MMTMGRSRKPIRKKLTALIIAAAVLLALLITLLLIRLNGQVAEFFTRTVSRGIVFVMGNITSIIPFSVYEILLLIVIATAITLFVLAIINLCKKRFYIVLKGLCVVMVTVLSLGNFYALAAGFSYYRDSVPLPMSEIVYEGEAINNIADYFFNDLIYLNSVLARDENGTVIPYSFEKLNELLRLEYEKLGNDYFFGFTPRVKSILNSWFMTDAGFTGVAFLPLGEPNINYMTPPSDLPHVMAHEIAHTKGVMRENEANLTAYYILLNSEDDYLRYCGYFAVYSSLLSMVALGNNFNFEKSNEYLAAMPTEFLDEILSAYGFWANYKGPISFLSDALYEFGRWFNNLYLNINGAENGEGSYDNPWDIEDSGETDPDTGEIIFTPIYSNIHKILFAIYENASLA